MVSSGGASGNAKNTQRGYVLGGSQVSLTYNYSPTQNNGQITSQQDAISGVTVSYSYDSLGQLTAASTAGPDWGLAFTYDGFGNRTNQSVTKGSGTTVSLSINPANNRITSSGYTYDANGNLTAMPGQTFTYDVENRLVQASGSSGTEKYGYDPFNRRMWKLHPNGKEEVTFYGAQGEQLAGKIGVTSHYSLFQLPSWPALINNSGQTLSSESYWD